MQTAVEGSDAAESAIVKTEPPSSPRIEAKAQVALSQIEAPLQIEDPLQCEAPSQIEDPPQIDASTCNATTSQIDASSQADAPSQAVASLQAEAMLRIEDPLQTEVPLLIEDPLQAEAKLQIEAILPPEEMSVSSSATVEPSLTDSGIRLGPVSITGHKKCEYGNGCGVQPSFNYPGEMGGMFCGCHRMEGMINVVNKMCEFEGCHKRPSLNYPGVRPAIRCGEHKLPGMTNSFRKLDTSVLSGELKEKAEELKKRPKRRGDMIKVQRNLIKEKIFSAVINDELSREGQSQSKSPPTDIHALLQTTSNSMPNLSIPPHFSISTSNLSNFSNLPNLQCGTQFQSSNAPFHANALSGNLMNPDFAAAYVANMNLFKGDLQSMKDVGFRTPQYYPNLFPGMNQLQFGHLNQFKQFNPSVQPQMHHSKPSLYSNPIPPILGYLPPPSVSKEGAEELDISLFANIASSISHDQTSESSKRQKIDDGARGKIAEILSRTTEEKSGGAFATVAGRSFRPIMGRATPMTFPKC